MIANLQLSTFTHAKCQQCGHFALIDKFEPVKINRTITPDVGFGTMEMYQLGLKCPMCDNKFCEALLPNEVN